MSIENKAHRASAGARAHLDGLLDEALEQTFPASDAVAIDIEREAHDREAKVLEELPHAALWQSEGRPEDCTETLTPAPQSSSFTPKRNDRQHQMARVLFVVIDPVHHGFAATNMIRRVFDVVSRRQDHSADRGW